MRISDWSSDVCSSDLHTGASRVVVFDHTRRSSSQTLREKHAARDPAGNAHTDYTDWSARNRVEAVMGEEGPRLLAGRFAIVHVWRSTERKSGVKGKRESERGARRGSRNSKKQINK